MTNIYDIKIQTKDGSETTLAAHKGKLILIINTASACGFTPQFGGLEKLYQIYKDQGLVVLGFPCNQFGAQDSGSQDEIESFCQMTFGVTFPILKKIDVNGENAAPLFEYLKKEATGIMGSKKIKWNFTKFLIGKGGNVITRYAPTTKPEKITSDIEKYL
jgi:glutathione peroxidase